MSEPLSIGVVCFPTLGGSGVIATELALGLARRGHRIHLIASARPSRNVPQGQNELFHEVRVPPYPLFEYAPYTLALASKIVEVVREHGLDLLQVHYAVPHAVSALLARQVLGPAAPAIVASLHGTDVTRVGSDPAYRAVTAAAVAAADGITTPSDYLRREARRRFGLPPERAIDVLPNFVDTAHFAPAARRDRLRLAALFDGTGVISAAHDAARGDAHAAARDAARDAAHAAGRDAGRGDAHAAAHAAGRDAARAAHAATHGAADDDANGNAHDGGRSDGPILFHVSTFREVKRVGDLIEVLARVRRELPARLVLVGDGPSRCEAADRAEELGVSDAVRFLGRQVEFAQQLRHADAFVLTSETESFGVAALEALSCGVPVFAYRVGGLPDVVVDGTGCLVEPLDVDRMARALIEVLSDPARHAAMGRAARSHAVAHFGEAAALDRYEAYFRRVLAGRDSTP